MYDQEHNKLNSREVVYPNVGRADVGVDKKGNTVISIGCATLSYPDMGIKPGKYEIKFKQDKLMPLFPAKMIKKDTEHKLVNPVMENPKNVIPAMAYDEDILGKKLLTYVQVGNFKKYCSFVVDNNFSVYKLSKFYLYVPKDAFTLKRID